MKLIEYFYSAFSAYAYLGSDHRFEPGGPDGDGDNIPDGYEIFYTGNLTTLTNEITTAPI